MQVQVLQAIIGFVYERVAVRQDCIKTIPISFVPFILCAHTCSRCAHQKYTNNL